MTAADMLRAAFASPRDPRSREYKAGVLAALEFRMNEADGLRCPYPMGTAQADAWYSGTDEGHRRALELLRACGENTP